MRVVSIGDLVTDYYYKNSTLLGVCGGMTSHNIIANLAHKKIPTLVIGVCGNDNIGKIAIKSLQDLKVETEIEIKDNIKTRCFHISFIKKNNKIKLISEKKCPICNKKYWYENSEINIQKTLNLIDKTDILVFDNLNEKNIKIINNTQNIKMLDLGRTKDLENLSNKEIKQILSKFTMINLNQRIEKYLFKRFKTTKILNISKGLNLLIVTKGKSGADFIYNNKLVSKKLKVSTKEIDPTGAGDAFFGTFIYEFIKNNYKIDINYIETSFKRATLLTNKVVQNIGSRGHLNKLYKIKKIPNICTCQDFIYESRKQITRCSLNVNNLKSRVLNAVKSPAYNQLKNINFSKLNSILFVGTGGSFPAGVFASRVINNLYGTNTLSILPRDILFRNNSKVDKVFLFSYSGTTNDLLEGVKNFNNNDKIVITKGQKTKVSEKTSIPKQNIISYRTVNNKVKERGFLAFEGTLSPASLFLKLYFDIKKLNNADKFILDSLNYWNNYFDEYFKSNKKFLKEILVKGNVLNIFTGDYTITASKYLESTLVESGIFHILIHEKKNFSHGRFINYENLSTKTNLYLKTKSTTKYEESLLEYLKDGNNIIIESQYEGILGEYDLLVAMQYLIYNIGKLIDIDLSKPKYTENALKVYFYKGKL